MRSAKLLRTISFIRTHPARLAAAYPDAKLIVLLREPVARAVSHYVAMAASGREPLTLADAVRRELEEPGTPDEIVSAGGPGLEKSLHRLNSYVGRGFYAAAARPLA